MKKPNVLRALIVVFLVGYGSLLVAQALQDDSYDERNLDPSVTLPAYKEAVLIYCIVDPNSPAITTSTDARVVGEGCATGDWSKSLDCRGYSNLTVSFRDFGVGSEDTDAKIYNCQEGPGFGIGGSPLGGVDSENASGSPTEDDPEPYCDDLTAATAFGPSGGILTGTGDNNLYVTGLAMNKIKAQLTCTGGCDSAAVIAACSR